MKIISRMALLAAGLSVAALPAIYAADESGASSTPAYENPPADSSAPPASARRHGDRPGMPGREAMGQEIKEKLGLSADQDAKIKAIHGKYQPQMQALRNDESLTPEARREKGRGIMEAQQKEIRAVLTPDQAKKWDEMRQNMRQRGKPGQRPEGKKRDRQQAQPPGEPANE